MPPHRPAVQRYTAQTDEGWTTKDNRAGLFAAIDHNDPKRPARVFDAVAKAYARYQP